MTRRAVRRDRGLRSGAPHTAPHAGPGAAPLRSGAAPAGGARKRGRAVGVRGEGRGCAKWRRVSPAPVPSRPAWGRCRRLLLARPPSSSLCAPRWALWRRALPAPPRPAEEEGKEEEAAAPAAGSARPPRFPRPVPPRPAPLRPEARMPEAAAAPSRGLRGERRRVGRGRCGAVRGGRGRGRAAELLRKTCPFPPPPPGEARSPAVRPLPLRAAALPPRTCRPRWALPDGAGLGRLGRPRVLIPLSAGERRRRRARVV